MNKYDETMLATAKLFGELSYCTKAKVGAVIAKDGRILATGYNGTISGQSNECEIMRPCDNCMGRGKFLESGKSGKCSKCNGKGIRLYTSPFTVHAEQNVISYCAKNGIATDGATMYITLSPCSLCAKLIAQSGIKRVVYLDNYKDTSGLDFLQQCGVQVCQY